MSTRDIKRWTKLCFPSWVYLVLRWILNLEIFISEIKQMKEFSSKFQTTVWEVLAGNVGSPNFTGNPRNFRTCIYIDRTTEKSNHFPLFCTELNSTIAKIIQMMYWIKSNHIMYKVKLVSQSMTDWVTDSLTDWRNCYSCYSQLKTL